MWDNRSRDDGGRRPPRRHCRATGGADRGARSGGTGRSRIGGGQGEGVRRSGPDCPSRLQIEKLTRQIYGQRSERTVRLLDQIELAFEELESSATEDEIAAERAVAKTTNVVAFTRKHPARQPFPEHLPREQVVEPGPTVCRCCGRPRRRKLREDIT